LLKRAEIAPTDQVSGLIDDLGRVALEVRIAAGCKLRGGTDGMAVVAAAARIDKVAAESHERRILTSHIQGHGSDFEPHSNLLLVAVMTVLIGRRRSDLADGCQDGEDRGSDPGDGVGTSSKLNLVVRHDDPLRALTVVLISLPLRSKTRCGSKLGHPKERIVEARSAIAPRATRSGLRSINLSSNQLQKWLSGVAIV